MRKSAFAVLLVFLVLIPLTLYVGTILPGRTYYLTATLIVFYLLVPFFLSFEGRKPHARELVVIAVMCAIAVASRFLIPIPHFKPIFSIIMLCGIAFGPETGFLVGAVSAFTSNFFAGQGPYTPWQMMAWGAGGMLTGFLFQKGWLPRNMILMAIISFLGSVFFVGPLLDTCTVFLSLSKITIAKALPVYIAGFSVNLSHGVSTMITMLLLAKPLLYKLERMQIKYGIARN